jgi:nucleotide-binding universal stress UspA family protein
MADRTLVFGDDGSPASDVAFGWVDHQSWPGWRLHVLHADAPPWGKPIPEEEVAPHPWDPPEPRSPSTTTGFAEVAHLLARADPRVALLAPADLVVVGPHGKGMLKALNLGSVSEWLLTHPPSPTVIARTAAPVRRALVAHDGSRSANLALETLASMPWIPGTECTAVVVDDNRVDVAAATAAISAAFAAVGIEPEVVVRTGQPTAAIAGEIDRRRPDLAVRRFSLGSTASAIARSATCSVLVACAESDSG